MADPDVTDIGGGVSRRALIKRGAILGGTLVWAAPAITELGRASAQTGSPTCDCIKRIFISRNGGPLCLVFQCQLTRACCDCVCNSSNPGACCDDCEPGTSQTFVCP